MKVEVPEGAVQVGRGEDDRIAVMLQGDGMEGAVMLDPQAFSEAEALELLECQRVKFTCLDCFASTGVVGGVLSGNTFNNLSLGGLTADGQPACNRLEELILDAAPTCVTTQPTLSVLYDGTRADLAIPQVKVHVLAIVPFVNLHHGAFFVYGSPGNQSHTLFDCQAWNRRHGK